MLFNSTSFLLFFAVIGIVYFALPERFRWMLLLLGSYVFYASWEPGYTLLLACLTLFNYFMAIRLGKPDAAARRKVILGLSLAANCGILFFFKYLNFFSASLQTVLGRTHSAGPGPILSIALPVGISFYTFKIMNYLVDVYRRGKEPEEKLGFFALYVAFFPQLIAGPIDRAVRLLPQFRERHPFDYARVTSGLKLMLWGFFQKMVVADSLAVMVDQVYGSPRQYEAPTLALATLFFTFQIFCDFSGYSDIAIGIARVFGYTSMTNFERPYFSRSIPEFWRRWHISLSTWFRDYLYIPLGGNRLSIPRWYLNLFIVFLVSGLWHGANWTFVAWGAAHGCLYVASVLTKGVRQRTVRLLGIEKTPRLHQVLQVALTFGLVALAWIFFRSQTISDAWFIVSRLFTGWGHLSARGVLEALSLLVRSHPFEFSVGVSSVAVMEVVHLFQERGVGDMLDRQSVWLRWGAYYALIAAVLLLGNFGMRQFIYLQF